MKHPPIDPNRLSYYYYSIAILDQVLCDDNEIKFSDFVRLKKISNIADPLGIFILGEDAIQNSKTLANGKLDICDNRIKQATLPPFGEGIMDMGTYNFTHYRSLVYSDCVIESSFIEDNPAVWNNNKEQVLQQIVRVLTSVRLLNSASIRCL